MARKKNKKQKAMSDSSDENMDGITNPHGPALGRTHPGGNSKGTCTQSSMSTGHQSTAHRSITHWTRRHHRLATSHRPTGHYTEYFKSVNHQSSSHQSLDLENINPGESHRPPVIRLYINLHLVILMPWA